MKRYFLFLTLVFAAMSFSCEEQLLPSEENRREILEYLETNNIDATEHISGLYYTIEEEGTGTEMPSVNSRVEVKYKGYLTDGFVFDETQGDNTAEFALGQVITGWRIGITLMKKGGKATFIIPSNLGYGFRGTNTIPPNAVIIFDVELINFSQ
ncbi:MAG: FKBP-type peptidyl-prolyl cis-trans isomerase [Saprospiraceae bacterium]